MNKNLLETNIKVIELNDDINGVKIALAEVKSDLSGEIKKVDDKFDIYLKMYLFNFK